jgi:hypothetical protein
MPLLLVTRISVRRFEQLLVGWGFLRWGFFV